MSTAAATEALPVPPTMGHAFKSAAGYFMVAVACTWAGYAVRHVQLLPARLELPRFIVFMVALFPAYLNRAILQELKNVQRFGSHDRNRVWLKTLSLQLPLLAGIPGLFVIGVFVMIFPDPSSSHAWIWPLLQVFVTAIPLYVISLRAIMEWPKDPNVFNFRSRSFFPAFATCLVPFTFGYSESKEIWCIVIAAALVLTFWGMANHAGALKVVLVGGAFLVVIVAAQIKFVDRTDFWGHSASVLFFGTIMTLAMGVAESWRVTTRIRNDQDFRLAGPYSDEEKKFYLSATNLATAIFLPLFLLTFIHPATTGVYLVVFCFFLVIIYILWLFFNDAIEADRWQVLGVISGLLFPVGISYFIQLQNVSKLDYFRGLSHDLLTVAGGVGFSALPFGYLTPRLIKYKRNIKRSIFGVHLFDKPYPCVCVTGILSASLSAVIAVYGFAANNLSRENETRLTILAALYFLIAAICGVGILVYDQSNEEGTPNVQELPPPNEETTSVVRFVYARRLLGVCKLVRVVPSLIAGLLAALVVLPHVGEIIAIKAGAAMMLVTMAGFAFDNIYDLPFDRRAGAPNPLIEEGLSTRVAWGISALAGGMAALISPSSRATAFIVLPTLFALGLYPTFTHRIPALKGLYTGGLVCAPLLYASYVASVHIPIYYYLIIVSFTAAREAFIDGQQVISDQAAGLHTLAVRLGGVVVQRWSGYVMMAATVTLIISTRGVIAKTVSGLCMLSVAGILYNPKKITRRAGWLRVSLLLGAIAIANSLA